MERRFTFQKVLLMVVHELKKYVELFSKRKKTERIYPPNKINETIKNNDVRWLWRFDLCKIS